MWPASMYDSAGVTPPETNDSPAGSQPNDAYGISGLNWRGAAGPAAGGPEPGRTGPPATAHAASTELPARQARRQRRRARPRRRVSRGSTREQAGSPTVISANSARIWGSITAGASWAGLVPSPPRRAGHRNRRQKPARA